MMHGQKNIKLYCEYLTSFKMIPIRMVGFNVGYE